ncbi:MULTISPECIES: DUF2147 domain-containing protein [unclassified Psychrobacter]|jgi:uncharacterized protein (DUF2147 family)|uniref:DUF2147 domain-containing protein n=1 Tax=Psychrobacter TaxID=497 RepID=UPI001055468A|nr:MULTISPECIES: DUF2147 domain-containing protein [unclassified Psychrobacter]KAA0923734.1 DUF2147 domain-containing protein [Psychrobacter sp. ANT_H56B]KAA0934566.1 DUF2147 domain-containing protein [Psychrobacter sp. ANT_H59]MBA2058180.1 DUF2147 domain-containing protein [Psychrobacter sp. D2]WAI86715.1 hypothetical protein SC65A3_00159 [Psychrobacter sp. SC65A.3]|tara:strand:- start:17761 stop:18144 length:384 start_codon:yes stop_codon:yes gene_type:complete
MKLFAKTTLAIAGISLASMAFAADPLANTTWQTYDEGKPKGVVKITESNGVLTGKLISTVSEKGQKHVGMTIISGLKADGNGKYSGGKITDPEKNKTYKLTANLNGSNLDLKGHLGPFSRSQTWKKK